MEIHDSEIWYLGFSESDQWGCIHFKVEPEEKLEERITFWQYSSGNEQMTSFPGTLNYFHLHLKGLSLSQEDASCITTERRTIANLLGKYWPGVLLENFEGEKDIMQLSL